MWNKILFSHTEHASGMGSIPALYSYGLGFTSQLGDYVGLLISLWLFLFASQPKEFVLGELKKLEQRSHKCVELSGSM
jgi:hypothetical protein